jgi:hypothetical protein
MKFAVYTPHKEHMCGGHLVVHRFIKILADLGHMVILNREPLFQCNHILMNNKDIKKFISENNDTVAIYTEHIKNNPFKATHVIRWILYHTNELIEQTWKPSDIYFYYWEGFRTLRNFNNNILNVLEPNFDFFYNKNQERSGYCHIINKKTPENAIFTEYNSVDITNYTNFKELGDLFNKYEYFLTYDDATYYSIAAALCGCKSIIITQNNEYTPEQYKNLFPIFKYGVAYGLTDIQYANDTIDLVYKHINELTKAADKYIENLISIWDQK